MDTITLASGCFWCTEAIFQRLKGVFSVIPGYTGGQTLNPSYEEVSSGETGHVESIQVNFDPKVISLDTILEVFWATHDPTTLNQQGADVGTQYRSAIFYKDQHQKDLAEKSKAKLAKSGKYPNPIVTEIVPLTKFYPAENDHQDYYNNHQSAPYCKLVIDPKIHKLMTEFKEETK